MNIKLQEGRLYKNEFGAVGKAQVWWHDAFHPFELTKHPRNHDDRDFLGLYREDGTSSYGSNIVCEVTPDGFNIEVGDYLRLADGSVVGPMRRDDRYGFRKEVLFVADGVMTPSGRALQIWEADGSIYGCSDDEALLHAVEKVEAPAVETLTVKIDTSEVRDMLDAAADELDKAVSQLAEKEEELRAAKDSFNILYNEVEDLKLRNDTQRDTIRSYQESHRDADAKIVSLDERLHSAHAEIAKLEHAILGLREERDDLEDTAKRRLHIMADLSAKMNSAESGLGVMKLAYAEAVENNACLAQSVRKLLDGRALVDKRLRSERAKRRQLQARLAQAEESLANVENANVRAGLGLLGFTIAVTACAVLAVVV